MSHTPVNSDWGSWMLGDLPEVLSRVSELVSPSSRVKVAEVVPPAGVQSMPTVKLVVPDWQQARRMRSEVETGEFLADFGLIYRDGSWSCVVAGLDLHVRVEVSER